MTRPSFLPVLARLAHAAAWPAAAALLGIAPPAAAQETGAIQLDQYRPAMSVDDGFVVARPDDRGHLRFGARLDLGYALNPLVVESTAGDSGTEAGALVEHSLRAHLGGSLGLFERVVVYVGLPIDLVQSGQSLDGLPAGSGAGLGDLALGVRGRLYGEPGELFAIALQLSATFPTAAAANAAQRYSGERGLTITPALLLELRPLSLLRITGNAGVRLRTESASQIANLAVGHELTWALGVTVDAIEDVLALYVEGFGGASFDALGSEAARVGAPIEALAGARVQAMPGLEVGLAVGTGLTRGVGAPDVRGVLTVGYAERPIREAVGDRDGDGLRDDVDACPDQPEDADGFEDEDGCPDLDDDRDGIADASDACPRVPEDLDGVEDTDGCPEDAGDTDGDGIADPTDACVEVPEDADGFEDADGCPDLDDDLDGVPDLSDRCPREPETRNGFEDEDGCPDETPAERALREGTARILFAHDSATPSSDSRQSILEVAALLNAHPEWEELTIEGHASETGDADYNLDLSRRRAERVRDALVRAGVAASRLVVTAYGHDRVEVAGDSDDAHAANRRVVFIISRRAAP